MIAKQKSLSSKYLTVLVLLFYGSLLSAQEVYQEHYENTFAVQENSKMEIVNQHGDINVLSWEKDSVSVRVDVRIAANNENYLYRQIDRLEIDLSKTGNFITAATKIDNEHGGLGEVIAATGDLVMNLVGNNKMEVDYEVYVPAWMEMEITNKFGNVSLPSLTGELEVSISHGKLKAETLENLRSLDLSYGDVDIDRVSACRVTSSYSDIEIEEADALQLNSNGSEFHLREVKSLELNSKRDDIYIDNVSSISGKTYSTDLNTRMISDSVDLSMKNGNFKLRGIAATFQGMEISGERGDVDLEFDPSAKFHFDINMLNTEEIRLNKSFLTIEESEQEEGVLAIRGESVQGKGTAFLSIDLKDSKLTIDEK